MWQFLVQMQSNPHVLLRDLTGSSREPSPDGWAQTLTNWLLLSPEVSSELLRGTQDLTLREGHAGSAALALGSREGAEVRALGLVITALVCLEAKRPVPLGCLKGAGGVEQCQGLSSPWELEYSEKLSSFPVFHEASLETDQEPEHKSLGSPGQRSLLGLPCTAFLHQ